jgi:predicted PhzF superfamily epimerase YddE/YHI9
MSLRFTQVDAFTSEPFRGNPAAVVLLPEYPSDGWLQAVAAEMNLSATAFLVRRADGFALRWFTTARELTLCGHGTLASAHTLWEEGLVPGGGPIAFHFTGGTLAAARRGDWIELDFPATPPVETTPPEGLAEALGTTPQWVGRSRLDVVAVLEDESEIRRAKPDLVALARVDARGVIITAAADGGSDFDFVSRFFAPGVGIGEDPVTGSAHCSLAPYWSGRLGKSELVGFQASARGGIVRTAMAGDRVLLQGKATLVARGELLVPI